MSKPRESERRTLKLASLDEILNEARQLHFQGYHSKGNWNLAQTCQHLADWARFPMDGFPQPPWFVRLMFGGLKAIGYIRRMQASILENGFKPGTPTAPDTVPAADAYTDEVGIENLSKVIERMKSYNGELQSSPLFGAMDRDLWVTITLLHAEHHLGFLIPANATGKNSD